MLGKKTTDAMFAVRMLMEKYREGQKELQYIRGSRESLRHGFKRRAVILYEKIGNGGKVYATCSGYVRGNRNSGVMCSRNYRKFQGQVRTARFYLLCFWTG